MCAGGTSGEGDEPNRESPSIPRPYSACRGIAWLYTQRFDVCSSTSSELTADLCNGFESKPGPVLGAAQHQRGQRVCGVVREGLGALAQGTH